MIDLLAAYNGQTWIDWSWVSDHTSEIEARLREHATLALWALVLGLLIAFPLSLLAVTQRGTRSIILATTAVLYTIPSLAAFALLLPWTKLSRWTALIPLVTYTLLILIRNTIAGFARCHRGADAAIGMGYSSRRKLFRVDLRSRCRRSSPGSGSRW
jgi:osmoprotectant transport system permease protein